MAKKQDFTGVNTGRIYAGIEQATAPEGQEDNASSQEAAARANEMRTQGRKGEQLPRINLSCSTENYDFIRIVARINGLSATRFVNRIVTEYRLAHPELYEKAKALIDAAAADEL